MVKLTAELILSSVQHINPVRERELDLRGYKIAIIENMGATLDQFDTVDFSDNDIRKLDGFPYLKRLKCLLLNNNRIVRIADNLDEQLPNLESIILTNNHIQELGDLEPLTKLKKLETLSLMRNPVCDKEHYREYIIYKLPQVRLLDFRKVRLRERETAEALFKSTEGKTLEKELSKKTKTFVPGGTAATEQEKKAPTNPKDMEDIRNAIANAKTLEEIERLNNLLQSGQIPNQPPQRKHKGDGDGSMFEEAVEEEEDMETEVPLNGNS